MKSGLVLFSMAFLAFTGVSADEWNISTYQGLYSQTNLGQILLQGKTHYQPGYISAATVGKQTDYGIFGMKLETEGQVVRHTGRDKHMEFNGLVMARTEELFHLPITFAMAEGLSLATRNPDLENPRKSIENPGAESEYSRNLLNYLVFEVEVGVPLDAYKPRAFVRVHHRSGIYGILCPPTCGSNYLGYGMRFSY
jgi:hypothetical protein